MKPFLPLFLAALCAALLFGCGEPAPSTKLAPDQPSGDASKLTAEQLAAAHKAGTPADRK